MSRRSAGALCCRTYGRTCARYGVERCRAGRERSVSVSLPSGSCIISSLALSCAWYLTRTETGRSEMRVDDAGRDGSTHPRSILL